MSVVKELKILGLYVRDYGSNKTPLVFIHSFPMNSDMWNKQVKFFRQDFRVISYDLRGLGRSDSKDNIVTMEKLVNDFFHILNALKIETTHACGLSMGGYILMRALQKNPTRFKSITLVNSKLKNDDNDTLLKRSSLVIKIQSGGRNPFLSKLIPKLLSKNKNYDLDLINEVKDIIALNSDSGICSGLVALSTRIDISKSNIPVHLPVLIISASDDLINKKNDVDNLFEYFKKNISHSFLLNYTMKECGHLCNIENPIEFNLILNCFLKCIENDTLIN